ncbi:MAG: glycerophosphodiester phosphodiesterase [Acidobacteria bacterium]|nr:glycerophosphodiester phosphodiesterase [Acidobacteriota bacterium]MBV9475739.1 glycerophosphodiester phosphodiesterase [Acidobacteriota bacterium]
MTRQFLIYGHRGSPKRFHENTIAGFEETLRAGADGFETDLRLLFDRTAVLYHDDEHDDDAIESLTATQLAERGAMVERLADLSRFAGRAQMILEVKRAKWEDILLSHIAEWPNIVLASFDHSIVPELRRRGATFPMGITFHGYLVDVAGYAASLGATWCFPNYHYVDRAMVDSLHARGIKVVPWTANRRREWDALWEVGCDGVITDEAEEAVGWRSQKMNEECRTQKEE